MFWSFLLYFLKKIMATSTLKPAPIEIILQMAKCKLVTQGIKPMTGEGCTCQM